MATRRPRPPNAALHGLVSYDEDGTLHHVGPFGAAVERDGGWDIGGFTAHIDEVDAVLIVATGAPREAEFGPVLVLRGSHRGRLGYYDDEQDGGETAIVYFGELFEEDVLIPMRYVVNVDVTLMNVERYRRDAPQAAAMMGVPSRPNST